ncbi:MAG: HEAT repeat domain-containing protein [Halolamina sp.]
MDDSTHSRIERLRRSIQDGNYADAAAALRAVGSTADDRQPVLRAVRDLAGERPARVAPLLPELSSFLTDDERAVRLTAAKLFVTIARSLPSAVRSSVDVLGERLADESEFYYVRARSAEALGYVAMEHPEVASPKLLADLRVGLSFDEPEVREKLAKALAAIAIGNPDRLSHHVSNLADHLDDENDLVRYHLCTALAVVGCVSPSTLTDASTALTERSADENPYVRGRAAEALGLLAETGSPGIAAFADALPEPNGMEPFEADRVRFARDALAGESSAEATVGSVEAIRETTADVEESVDAPERTHTCPHCGLSQQEAGPPTCPRCGVPR